MQYRLLAPLMLAGLVPLVAMSDPPRKLVSPTNLKALNTAGDETDPSTTPSDLTLYYSARIGDRYEVWMSTRRDRTWPWRAGKPVPDLRGKADYRSVFLTTDERYPRFLYYATDVDVINEGAKGTNYDIYFLTKHGPKDDWTTPTPIHHVDTSAAELYPWLSANGRQLYFSRLDKDGWHVYLAERRTAHESFGQPRRLALPTGFHHATVSPDGRVMYLQGPLPKNRWGLFRSDMVRGSWTHPQPLDMLNSPEAPTGDQAPCLSRNGYVLYFASDRPGGQGGLDLWMVPVPLLKH